MSHRVVLAGLAAALFAADSAWAQSASITVFRQSPAGLGAKLARVSGGGNRAVGWTFAPGFGYTRCVWTAPTNPPIGGQGYNISEDGQTICGDNVAAGYRATTGGPWQFVRGFNGEAGDTGTAWDISADRQVLAGTLLDDDGVFTAFRFTVGSGAAQRLGRLSASHDSVATAMDASGNVIAGFAVDDATGRNAWRWTAQTGMVFLGPPLSYALDLSADGNTVVGEAGAGNSRAYIWNTVRGTLLLPLLPGSVTGYARAWGVSGDGSIVVGEDPGPSLSPPIATYWSAHTGLMRLDDALEQKFGLTLPAGWSLMAGTDVSDNGRFISGYGRDENNIEFGFVITLPSAPAGSVLALGALAAARRRRPV